MANLIKFITEEFNGIIDSITTEKVESIFTIDEVHKYNFKMKKQNPEIKKCILYIEREGGKFKFSIEQLFVDEKDEFIFGDEEKKDLCGRRIKVEGLDEELSSYIKGKDKVVVKL